MPRVVHAGGDATGAEIERALTVAVQESGAEVHEGWLATDLLVENGSATGVIVLDADGTERVLRATHTVIATGGAGQCFAVTTNPPLSTGDGVAMALRAGVAVADLEFMQFHPTALHHPSMPRPLLSEALRGEGAILRDDQGEAFMAAEHPLGDLAPRDVVARAISRRLNERGLDHLWLDATGIGGFTARFPTIWRACQSVDLDPTREWLPVAPAAHYLCGGVCTDLDGATTLPGLWACGEAACTGVHGANRLASNSLLENLVFAARVGRGDHAGQGLPGCHRCAPGHRPRDPPARRRARAALAGRRADPRRAAADHDARRGRRAQRREPRPRLGRAGVDGADRRRGGEPPGRQHRARALGHPRVASRAARTHGPTSPRRRPTSSAGSCSRATPSPTSSGSWRPRGRAHELLRRPGRRHPRRGRAPRWRKISGRSATSPPRSCRATRVPSPKSSSRGEGVVAGTACATEVFAQLDPTVQVDWLVDDGGLAGAGAKIGSVSGSLRSLLTGERTALNFLCHLSGVATATHRFVLAAGDRVRVLDTRKTLPGLRSLEKAAVRAGGGVNHRGSLSDLVLLKDNHLAGIGITAAVQRAHDLWPGRAVEVECDRLAQVEEAVSAGREHGAPRQHDARRDPHVCGARPQFGAPHGRRGLGWRHARERPRVRRRRSRRDLDERDHAVGAGTRHRLRHRVGCRNQGRWLAMLVAIDCGNTQTVIGLFSDREIVDHWRIATISERTSDELALMFQQFLAFHGTPHTEVTGMVIGSGVPRITMALREMSERYFGFPALVLEAGVRTGMPILYDEPKNVGADRIANAIGAYDLYGGPTIIVDFGTANTVDAVSTKGEYLGGAIFPGIEISLDALFERAAMLRRVELVAPKNVIGKSTIEAIQSGAVYGYSGQVDGLVDRFQAELGPCTVISTGGLAQLIMPHSRTIQHFEPWLTLQGLRLVYERNS